MGNNFLESIPAIKGRNENLSVEEKNYFNKINSILHIFYRNNLYSDYNLEVSLEQKSFENSQIIRKKKLEDISWLDYIYRHLNYIKNKYNDAQWTTELEELLSQELFLYENKFHSNIFYNEFFFVTFPKELDEQENEINNVSFDFNNQSLMDLGHSIDKNPYNELDVTENFGGSYLEMNTDNLDKNDPTFQYRNKRKNVKKYIKILKDHIYNNHQHPINKVVFLFTKVFCNYINKYIQNMNSQIKNNSISDKNPKKNIKDFEKEITESLRNFIITMHSSLKLFYSTSINYSYFDEEKDDVMNLITSLIFKTGKLYETIYSLYYMSFNEHVEELQDKFNDLKDVKPRDLGVQVKFCLDEDTLDLQRNILKEKQNESNEKAKEELKKQSNEENPIQIDNVLFQIKENDEEENEKEEKNNKNNFENVKKSIKSIDINMNSLNNINDDNINDLNNDKEEDDYLLEKINDDISIDTKMDVIANNIVHIRNTINSFNNKKYLFPKIRKNLQDTLSLNDKYIQEAKASGKLPIPFSSAINLLKNIRNFKTPFEKIVILAALSDQITESVSTFWNSMMNYIKNSYLFIEADEIMAIFVFIIIKAQMPELLVETKIITNFTTPCTRAFNISYNLTLMEASIETISKMNSKEIASKEKQLKEVRKSIAVLTTQRISRLSRLSATGNPFS